MDLIKLEEVYYKKFRRKDFSFKIKNHHYSTNVINVTFKYAVKEWNQVNRNTYIKLGYNYNNLEFIDCIARNNSGEVVGVRINEKINQEIFDIDLLKYFEVKLISIKDQKNKSKINDTQIQYVKIKEPKTVKSSNQLRKELYVNGFISDTTEYCRFKRSSGSARVGKCLFINKPLFKSMLEFSAGNITLSHGQEIDLASYESYISLTSSSIIDTLQIRPENILVVDDYSSAFKENVIVTYNKNGELTTEERKDFEISNSIWDGQSLMDISLFGDYKQYGMVLLRNLMFKSCCFNTNIQQWFKDNNITDVTQLNGYTRAKEIKDVKLITTPNSIKYLKFGSLDKWLDHIYLNFGIVKHDKKTHFFEGKLVQTHYQLLNTLQLSKDETKELLQESLDFAQQLRDNPAVVRYYIKYPDIDELEPLSRPMKSKNDVTFNLMCINDKFTQTKYYQDFMVDLLKAYYKNLKNGRILVNGNYSTLLGNPIEMLQHAIGSFQGNSQIGVGNIHSTRFEHGKTLLGSRSPHITVCNVWLPRNAENKLIDEYVNLTDEIVCINSINENVLNKLAGCDFDSDSVLLTDNEILIKVAERNYNLFKTSVSNVSAKKIKRYYTPEQLSDLDIKTSVNKIGEIVNLSQELNSLMWDRLYYSESFKDIEELYFDICQLNVMSETEIDMAKKEFDIDNTKELKKIRDKYNDSLIDNSNKKKMPHFFAHIARQKGYYNPNKKNYCKYNTTMDYVQTVVNGFRVKTPYKKQWRPLVSILDNSRYRSYNVNQKQIDNIFNNIRKYISETKLIYHNAELSESNKRLRRDMLYEGLVAEIENEIIGQSTMFKLLHSAEDRENSDIKNMLLSILFQCGNQSFNSSIIQSSDEVEEISQNGDGLYLFGIGFEIHKKTVSSSK